MAEPILKSSEFEQLDKERQYELLQLWRSQGTDSSVYRAMGIGSNKFYRIVKELGCPPKDTNPYKNRLTQQQTGTMTEVKEAVSINEEPVQNTESVPTPKRSIALSLEQLATREQAEVLFQSIIGFLGDDEYKIKIEISI